MRQPRPHGVGLAPWMVERVLGILLGFLYLCRTYLTNLAGAGQQVRDQIRPTSRYAHCRRPEATAAGGA
jgi:hypothetical protein